MKTKLDYYRVFYETARFQSFSTAAQHLYISQSAISQCIQQLETDLKVQLFIRTKRGISLTNEGQMLYTQVENAINSIEQGESQLEKLRHLESGELRIAAGDTITTHFLLKYLEEFHATYPDIKIEMANSYSSQMLALVKERKTDLAFVNMPMEDDALVVACGKGAYRVTKLRPAGKSTMSAKDFFNGRLRGLAAPYGVLGGK